MILHFSFPPSPQPSFCLHTSITGLTEVHFNKWIDRCYINTILLISMYRKLTEYWFIWDFGLRNLTVEGYSWQADSISANQQIPHLLRSAVFIDAVYLYVYMALQPLLGLGLFFCFWSLLTVGRTPLTGDQPFARPLPAHRTAHKHRINTHKHPCLEWDSKPGSQRWRERRHFML
jgi:hypothetical protein